MKIAHRPPWLVADLGAEMRVLSWATHNGGLASARTVAWLGVRNADLTPELDVETWLKAECAGADLSDAVTMLTSRDLAHHHTASHRAGSVAVECLATVGLGNSERIGHRAGKTAPAGTINILAIVQPGLNETAMYEALTIAAEARTLAIVEAGRMVTTGVATGTGTDCIAIASPVGDLHHAGKHTDVGEALGRAVYKADSAGAVEWMKAQG